MTGRSPRAVAKAASWSTSPLHVWKESSGGACLAPATSHLAPSGAVPTSGSPLSIGAGSLVVGPDRPAHLFPASSASKRTRHSAEIPSDCLRRVDRPRSVAASTAPGSTASMIRRTTASRSATNAS